MDGYAAAFFGTESVHRLGGVYIALLFSPLDTFDQFPFLVGLCVVWLDISRSCAGHRLNRIEDRLVCWLLVCLLNVPATCYCISGTDVLQTTVCVAKLR